MLKKILFTAAVVLALGFTSACSSYQIGQDINDVKFSTNPAFESDAHLNVDIWGIYIFNFPIFTGSARTNGECRIFEDTVNVNGAIRLLTGNAKAKLQGQVLTDIQTNRTTVWLWPTVFFVYKDVQASGTVLK